MMDEIILLAMHGAPPRDFPSTDLAELSCLRARMELSNGPERAFYERRCFELEMKMRSWPRNLQNDPSYAASLDLARHLSLSAGREVVLGFIDFANPGLDAAFEQAGRPGIARVIVVTPMVNAGGEYSERDLRDAIRRARQRFAGVEIVYAWPFEVPQVAQFLAGHLGQLTQKEMNYA